MSKEAYQDDIFILRVQNWQTADKYAVCFSRKHGKISFIAFGARYPKNTTGRLVQPFSRLKAHFTPGQKLDTLRQAESLVLPTDTDIDTLAYGAVIAETVESMTSEHEAQEEIFDLLEEAFDLLQKRNKRLVTLSTMCKLLVLCGFSPNLDSCTSCKKEPDKDGFFSLVQGGFLCAECATEDQLPFSLGTLNLMVKLINLDFTNPKSFSVKGFELAELESVLVKFIMYQIDRPLKSLNFLAQIQK